MALEPPKPLSLRDIDFGHYFKHYLNLLWRWKWWIIIVFPLIAAIALYIAITLSYGNPKLSAKTLIGLENVSNLSPVQEVTGYDNRKTELLKTRSFLAEIVNKLSLQLHLQEFPRHDIFDSIRVDSTAILGRYEFKIDKETPDHFTLFFLSKQQRKTFFWQSNHGRIVENGKLSNLRMLNLQGIMITFTEKFTLNPHDLQFSVTNMRFAVENIVSNLQVNAIDDIFRNQRNRTQYNISISMEGKDYTLITKTINAIADAFIEKLSVYKKIKTKKVLDALELQLTKSKTELTKTENKIKDFMLNNPSVGLNQSTQNTIQSLIDLETNAFSINNSLNEARKFQSKYAAAFKEDKEQVGLEIVLFLINNNISSASIFQSNLQRLIEEKRTLQLSLSSGHPNIKQNQEDIDRTLNKTYSTLLTFIKNTEGQVKQRATGIQNISQKLKGLPSKELQLAELQRAQSIASGIYSQVLDRYNKAKVAETVETADVYIMEYAVPPIPPPKEQLLLIALGISLLSGLSMAFGPPIVFDLISKTARTEFELSKMTDMVVLESIPKIVPKKQRKT